MLTNSQHNNLYADNCTFNTYELIDHFLTKMTCSFNIKLFKVIPAGLDNKYNTLGIFSHVLIVLPLYITFWRYV